MASPHSKAAGRKLKMVTISGGKGQSPVSFHKGGLHQSLGVPQGQKIPSGKMQSALAGSYGPKAKKQANFARGMLAAGRRTANRGKL